MVKGANSAPFFLLAEAALNRKENSGSFDGTACIFACATINRYKVFSGILGHSLSSFWIVDYILFRLRERLLRLESRLPSLGKQMK